LSPTFGGRRRSYAHWKNVRGAPRDVGRALLDAFQAIETANPHRLQGVFGNAAWTDKGQIPDETLKNLIEHFSRHTLSLANVPFDTRSCALRDSHPA